MVMLTYPEGTTVVEYATGPFSSPLGERLIAELTVKMLVEETHLVRHPGGGVLVPTVVDVKAPADSETRFQVPAVDQAGWRTPEGAERTGWTYEVRVNILNEYGQMRHRWTKYISPLEVQASKVQDLDLVEALSEPVVGEIVPARFVRTVNGTLPDESGDVLVFGGDGGEVDLSPYVQKSELRGAPSELATQGDVTTALSQAGFAESDHQHEVSGSAFVGATGRVYAVVAGVMRNPGTGWAALDDTIHRHANVESTTTGPDSITVNFPTLGAQKVVSFVCTPDETLTKAGYACAASVSLTTAEITVTRNTPMSDYVQYNATNGGWTSLNGVFRNLTFSNGTLTMEHDPVGGSNFMDFQVTSRGDALVSGSAQAGGSTQTVTKIDFRDYTGALITEPSSSLRAFVSRGSSGPVDPSTLTSTRYPASNIWFQGIFEL